MPWRQFTPDGHAVAGLPGVVARKTIRAQPLRSLVREALSVGDDGDTLNFDERFLLPQ